MRIVAMKDTIKEMKMKARKMLRDILGRATLLYIMLWSVNAWTEIRGTNRVIRYKRPALITNENKPRVIRLIGKEMICRTGLSMSDIPAKIRPPRKTVG